MAKKPFIMEIQQITLLLSLSQQILTDFVVPICKNKVVKPSTKDLVELPIILGSDNKVLKFKEGALSFNNTKIMHVLSFRSLTVLNLLAERSSC